MRIDFEDIRRYFVHTPAGRAIVQAKEKSETDAKQEHIDAVAKIEQEYRTSLPSLLAQEAAAVIEHDKAHAAWQASAAKLRQAIAARSGARSTMEAAIQRHHHALRKSASPLIRAFGAEVWAMWDRDRHIPVMRADHNEVVGGWYEKQLYSTAPNLKAHLEALQSARVEIAGWELHAISESEVETRIAAMRERLEASRRKCQQYAVMTAA
jgi:hypothetical protein